ncbi:hypothetical protein O9929_25685 [Vibrio lentus]|nr:hypothetical protein [Vibrio lentus]
MAIPSLTQYISTVQFNCLCIRWCNKCLNTQMQEALRGAEHLGGNARSFGK